MTVSRYVVDVIVIAGLVLGTLGVLYLSQGLFGRVQDRLLRRLLTFVPLVAFLTWFAAEILMTDYSAAPLVAWPIGATLGVFFGYAVSDPDVAISQVREENRKGFGWKSGIGCLVFLAMIPVVVLIAGNVLLSIDAHSVIGKALVESVVVIAAIVTWIGWAIVVGLIFHYVAQLVVFTHSLSERRLQIFGLIFTLLGIATQFVAPVLDLFQVTIK